nr:gamma-aminobutyric acid receptor subunit pi-like [Oncorhynchus nerka]
MPVVSSSQPNQVLELGSTQKDLVDQSGTSVSEAEATEKKPEKGCGLTSFKNAARRVLSVFSVENPHNIDRHARTMFPLTFLAINVFYWLYYLFI